MWRKPQTRKHKTWDGDGLLYIKENGYVLKCRETGKEISSGLLPSGWSAEPGKEYSIGGKDVEIDEVLTREQAEREMKSTMAEGILPPDRPLASQKVVPPWRPPMMATTPAGRAPSISRGQMPVKSLGSRPFRPPSRLAVTSNVQAKANQDERGMNLSKPFSGPSSFKKQRLSEPSVTHASSTAIPERTDATEGPQTSHFSCLYRKVQSSLPKKNVTWEGDGFLILFPSQSGTMAVLKDSLNGKTLGSMMLSAQVNVRSGASIKVGNKQLEIQRPATASEVQNLESGQNRHDEEVGWTDIVKNIDTNAQFKNPLPSAETSFGNKNTKPFFDPNVPGAVVFSKPTTDWLSNHNPKFAHPAARLLKNNQLMLVIRNAPVVDVVLDPRLSRCMRPHQFDGVKFMYECTMGMREHDASGCILADTMGLGKSLQAIALLWTLLRQNPLEGKGPVIQRAMIVSPVTLVKNWAREIKKWLGRSRIHVFAADSKTNFRTFTSSSYYNVLIIGYEKLRTLVEEINGVYPPIGLIIADEGHRLKSIEAKTTQALRSLKTRRRVVLTGTPIQNNLNEYYAMVDFVNPGILSDFKTFKKTYEQPILKSREPGSSPAQKELGQSRADELAELSNSYVLRRGSDVIAHHLPPRHDYCVFIALTATQKKIYKSILASPETRAVFAGESSQHLVLINTLKKLCNSAGLLMDEHSIASLAQSASSLFPQWVTREEINLSGKLIALASFLKVLRADTDEKIILVSNFTSTLDIIQAHCHSEGYSFCRLDGKTPQNKRDDIVQTFNRVTARSQFVFLLSSKSGGVGLNLIGASRLILFDSDWNPATDLQAMARIWRQGQKKPCHIYRFLSTGALDECIFQRQVTKTGLASDLIKDSGGTQESSDRGNTFTSDELRRLFELHTESSCHTHDLLGCKCLEPKDVEVLESTAQDCESDEESLPDTCEIFQPASQYKPLPVQRKTRKKLAELETWDHISPLSADSADELEDVVLKRAIVDLKKKVTQLDTENDDEEVNEHSSFLTRGGEITFVFHKTNTVMGTNEDQGRGM
ncbi:hypothetical protein CROQUDRAFT_97881 [Cronartium quercuum f. sp. fusiforme G11]|uniref:DNA repair and recombination protein RAD54B n=1 Tax=Cronartium quercuum f. sp. fusiforme G11 TaxID=708437 RepID=A0A9P6T7P4_9BASI|nr:hypothetical protein CROQUDRAFT_97881 [Cronartium quercuum f. sp. fusiforme G11]